MITGRKKKLYAFSETIVIIYVGVAVKYNNIRLKKNFLPNTYEETDFFFNIKLKSQKLFKVKFIFITLPTYVLPSYRLIYLLFCRYSRVLSVENKTKD